MPILENAGNTSIESNATVGATVNLITSANKVSTQAFYYAQSISDSGDSGWIPIAAEAKGDCITMIIRFSKSDSNDPYIISRFPIHQAVDYSANTGDILGLHLHDGGYKTAEDLKIEVDAAIKTKTPNPNQKLAYFLREREQEFLARFDWVINPKSASAAAPTNTTVVSNITVDLSSLIQGASSSSDAVSGSAKDDVLGAGKGADKLTGAGGADQFVFNTRDKFGKKGADTITDFKPEEGDQLVLSPDALPGLKAEPTLQAVTSKKALKAAQKSDSDLIYYQPFGQLFYDQNGSGKGFGSGGLFAVLSGAPVLEAEDLAVF